MHSRARLPEQPPARGARPHARTPARTPLHGAVQEPKLSAWVRNSTASLSCPPLPAACVAPGPPASAACDSAWPMVCPAHSLRTPRRPGQGSRDRCRRGSAHARGSHPVCGGTASLHCLSRRVRAVLYTALRNRHGRGIGWSSALDHPFQPGPRNREKSQPGMEHACPARGRPARADAGTQRTSGCVRRVCVCVHARGGRDIRAACHQGAAATRALCLGGGVRRGAAVPGRRRHRGRSGGSWAHGGAGLLAGASRRRPSTLEAVFPGILPAPGDKLCSRACSPRPATTHGRGRQGTARGWKRGGVVSLWAGCLGDCTGYAVGGLAALCAVRQCPLWAGPGPRRQGADLRVACGASRMFAILDEAAQNVGPNGVFHRPNMVNGGIPAPPPTYVPPVGSSFNT